MIDRLSQNQDLVSRHFNESEFQDIAFRELAPGPIESSAG